jgi:hypothetical protein
LQSAHQTNKVSQKCGAKSLSQTGKVPMVSG